MELLSTIFSNSGTAESGTIVIPLEGRFGYERLDAVIPKVNARIAEESATLARQEDTLLVELSLQ